MAAVCFSSLPMILLSGPVRGQVGPRADSADPAATVPFVAPKLSFRFAGEQWRNVLEWFADAAEMNLDWQELPDDTLNLTTQGSYTVAQALDVLNLHLLTRGFTLLRRDDVLFLVRLDESLNSALVPRVAPEELDKRGQYEYCKVSFPLDWMIAETATQELQPMLSAYGRITPLRATNRIEVMDAAVNLREVHRLLISEQSDNSEQRLVEEFILEHASASEALEKLRQILGLETPVGRMSDDQMRTVRQQYELRAELVKRLGDQAPRIKEQNAEIYLVANERKNSVLANASPDKIAIVRQTIRALDVPAKDGLRLSDVTTMKVYQLNGVEAEALQDILEDLREIGKIHPQSRFSEDDDRQILFAYASIEDHLTIQSVMEQLAYSARTFRMIPLRNLRSVDVANSIGALMGAAGADGNDDGGGRDRRRRSDDGGWRGFRVEADPPNNRLLLFATDTEFKQVEELLVKLGEQSSGAQGGEGPIRVVDMPAGSADQLLDQLRAVWPAVGSNQLQIEIPGYDASGATVPPLRNPDGNPSSDIHIPPFDRDDISSDADPGSLRPNRNHRAALNSDLLLASLLATELKDSPLGQVESPHRVPEKASTLAPLLAGGSADDGPITIRQGPDGELILSSDDIRALDQLEELIAKLVPKRAPYTIFHVQHTSPYSIELTLREIFSIDSTRATTPMSFVSDATTKSIMVFGAGIRDLREIEQLIKFYDQPQTSNPLSLRKPRFFQLNYAQADSVATVLKEIYRDLLSVNDKELARGRDDQRRSTTTATYSAPSESDEPRPRYQGMLSLGVAAQSNAIIVSAPEFLANEIAETIKKLDLPTASPETRVVAISGAVSPALVAENLSKWFAPRPTASPDMRDRERGGRDDRDDRQQDDDGPRRDANERQFEARDRGGDGNSVTPRRTRGETD